jgi:GNAT superfamily N-acetyltransferase
VVRLACENDLDEIGAMVQDFVRGHKAEHHPRPREVLRQAYFGAQPVARLFVAVKGGRIVGMGQWYRIFEMFWAMHGGKPEYLYVRPFARGLGVAAAILAAICDDVRRSGRWPTSPDSRRGTSCAGFPPRSSIESRRVRGLEVRVTRGPRSMRSRVSGFGMRCRRARGVAGQMPMILRLRGASL